MSQSHFQYGILAFQCNSGFPFISSVLRVNIPAYSKRGSSLAYTHLHGLPAKKKFVVCNTPTRIRTDVIISIIVSAICLIVSRMLLKSTVSCKATLRSIGDIDHQIRKNPAVTREINAS